MGTRGFFGFVVDGEEKIAYNHSDSYPSGLGVDVLNWLAGAVDALDLDEVRTLASDLRVVKEGDEPTLADIERLKPWTNLNVGSQSTSDWYCLLRETQGDPERTLSAGFMEDASQFSTESLFAEWGYLVDFDRKTLEVYRGFQKAPHAKGRFAERAPERGYWPVALVVSWPLDALPTEKGFLKELDGEGEA